MDVARVLPLGRIMRARTPLLIIIVASAVVSPSLTAFARTRLAEGDGTAPAPVADAKASAAWFAAYEQARAAMLAGSFAVAAARFATLVGSAPDPGSRFLAAEMMSACRTWAAGGLVLTTPHAAALVPPALLEDHRTTDEIAILYTNAVLYGLYAGVVVDVWSEPKSAGSAIMPPLIFAGVSAGAVALLDKAVNLRYGVAQSIVSGLYVGLEEGIAWCLWHEASAVRSSEWGAKAVTTLILGMGTAGAIAGGVVGSYLGTTPGRAALMGSAAMWSGLVAGTLVGGLTKNDDPAMLSAAIMLNVGAVAGVLAGAQVSPSIARVRFIDLGGISGGLLVGGLYWAMRDRDAGPGGVLTATSLGMAAGLATSWLLTGDMEQDHPRKQRELSFVERLMPTVAPAASGTGFVVGVASTI
jgi:hypothetical protein